LARRQAKKTDSRGDATRLALLEAAESLFAEHGFDGVSTRQIGAAIGSANTNVVAYHFGGKDALIREIYRHRLPDIDRRRRELLDTADAEGLGADLPTLMRCFYQPLFEQTDSEGRHSYARFIAALDRSGKIATRAEVMAEFPETTRLDDRIRACLSAEITVHFSTRVRLLSGLVSATLRLIDTEAAADERRAHSLFDNALSMVVAAMRAPAPPSAE
jgi:AcrR family transcriptional regulator